MKKLLDNANDNFTSWDKFGKRKKYDTALKKHVKDTLNLKYIDKAKVKRRIFKVVVDCVNGVYVYVVPQILKEL